MSLEAPPPSRHISSKPISMDAASIILQRYLLNSESHSHLHPDALITPSGVTFSSHGGPMGGVVMHNLRRVAAGLRGEYLEPESTPAPEDGDGDDGNSANKGANGGKRKRKGAEEDWQEMAEYEQEEGRIEVGEVGPRSNAVQEGGEEPQIEATDAPADGKLDKEARKRAKKERNQQQKKEKEKKRAQKNE
ncbi:hypothetical protein IQ07DRAFT_588478 [Pyrenochaeta sp. DS3sAY3a]|nr:hypothetical protein IQ07DRAFT_588478 [Pyrenochaeta sp. DS3sAY3a]